MFLRVHEDRLHLNQLLSAENFGRFVSRNLYWWGGWKLLGENAQGYFMVNLALAMSTSVLLLRLCWDHSVVLGLLLAAAYWTAGATVGNLSWLSNSQHLLAHTLMALYFCLAQRAWRQESMLWLLASLAVYALALSANVLSAVAMLFPFLLLLLLLRAKGRFAVASSAALALQLSMALLLVITVKPEAGSPYAMTWAWPVVIRNMNFYHGHWAMFIGFSALLMGFAWKRFRAGDHLEAWLMLSGPAFILPFLPLAQQRYINYAAFSHSFFFVGLCLCACRAQGRWLRPVTWGVAGLMTLAFALQTHRQMSYFQGERRGATQRELVHALDEVVRAEPMPAGSVLCFSEKGERHVPGNPLPGFWWGVGFGDAFKKFVSDQYKYELLSDDVSCSRHFDVDGPRLHVLAR